VVPWRLESKVALRPRLAAVSYLNTAPLVWGMKNGPQQVQAELEFFVPSECARRVSAGQADLGIVPVAEMARLGWEPVPGTGIACLGPVRSILLISRVEPRLIRTLAADSGSRTSVRLARIILAERYGATPATFEQDPGLGTMLAEADAALLIGDAALAIEPSALPYYCLDLGTEWMALSGKPMVFALWAGPAATLDRYGRPELASVFAGSLDFGLERMEEIVRQEAAARAMDPALVHRYLTHYIRYRVGREELDGLAAYLKLSAMLPSEKAAPASTL